METEKIGHFLAGTLRLWVPDLTALTHAGAGSTVAYIQPNSGTIEMGPSIANASTSYSGFTGPATFGTSGYLTATSGSGDEVGISNVTVAVLGVLPAIYVPTGYVLGSALSDTATFSGQTFTSLGLTAGTYTYNWGTGETADSFTVQIGASSVPEPERK